jgi:hypothetical protein
MDFVRLAQWSAKFSLPRTAFAIHIFVEGPEKKLIMSWTVNETVFLFLKSVPGIHSRQ